MSETVTTGRARNLLDSLFVSEHADIRDLIAEALEGRDRIEKLTGVLEGANATARRRGARIAELTALLAAASYPGHYISTACQGALHDHCRRNSKWSDEPCLCGCGHDQAKAKPTYQELTASLGAAQAELATIKRNVEWRASGIDRAGRAHHTAATDRDQAGTWASQYCREGIIQERYKAGQWTPAEPRAGEMTKGQK